MKKTTVFFWAIFLSMAAFSQYDTTAPYSKNKTLPDFNLLSPDSVVFTQNILVENPQISGTGKSTIVMLFHPECDHCQKQLELMLTIPAVSNTTNLILVADETLQKLKIFYNKFHLEKYPWINIGKDYKHFFGPFYRPKTVPVLIFYNNQKNLKSYKQGNISEKEINKALE